MRAADVQSVVRMSPTARSPLAVCSVMLLTVIAPRPLLVTWNVVALMVPIAIGPKA